MTAESFSGFTILKKEDKDLLKSKLGTVKLKKAGKGNKRKAQAVDETDAKRTKTAEEDECEKKLKVSPSWPKLKLVFLPSDYFTFCCKLDRRIWCCMMISHFSCLFSSSVCY